jgi:uncharacterized membrane protein HdeD (DUF308 family)
MARVSGAEHTRAHGGSVVVWITLVRAALALALGMALILHPDKTRPMLANFMGMFWLAAGIMSLRWSPSGRRAPRAARVAGVIGVVAGLLVLGRFLIEDVVSEAVGITLLGGVAVLTGIFHVMGGFERERTHRRLGSWTSVLLGTFEIVLGALLLTTHADFGRGLYLVATAWAFTGAVMLFGEALRTRAQARGRQTDSG